MHCVGCNKIVVTNRIDVFRVALKTCSHEHVRNMRVVVEVPLHTPNNMPNVTPEDAFPVSSEKVSMKDGDESHIID